MKKKLKKVLALALTGLLTGITSLNINLKSAKASMNSAMEKISVSAVSSYSHRAIVYGSDRFVTVGASGKSMYSYDGSSWRNGSGLSSNTFYDVTYADSKYVAVGESGKSYYSSDGSSWTAMSGLYSCIYYRVVYGNDRFVTVGQKGYSYYSTDGKTWNSMSGLPSTAFVSATYTGDKFVTVSATGLIYYSEDGQTWKQLEGITNSCPMTPDDIIYFNNRYIVSGSYGISSISENGGDWSSTTKTQSNNRFTKLYYSNNMLFAVGNYGKVSYSKDGDSWYNLYGASKSNCMGIAYGQDKLIVISGNNEFYSITLDKIKTTDLSSPDSVNWETVTAVSSSTEWNTIAYGDSKYLMSTGTSIYSSVDGVNDWAKISECSASPVDMIYANGKFVACTGNGVAWSDDGTSWSSKTFSKYGYNRIRYVNNLFIALSSTGSSIAYSSDGVNWTETSVGVTAYDVCYDGEKYIICGSSTKIVYSTDLSSFNSVTMTSTGAVYTNIAYGNGIYTIANGNGYVYVSNDINTWNYLSYTKIALQNIYYDNDRGFVGCSVNPSVFLFGKDMQSCDFYSASSYDCNGSTITNDGKIVMCGNNGKVYISNKVQKANAAPVITVTGNPENWTNKDVTLLVMASDDKGEVTVTNPNGTTKIGSDLSYDYTIDKNGEYEFSVVDSDNVTNSVTVNVTKIDKTTPKYEITQEKRNSTTSPKSIESKVKGVPLGDSPIVSYSYTKVNNEITTKAKSSRLMTSTNSVNKLSSDGTGDSDEFDLSMSLGDEYEISFTNAAGTTGTYNLNAENEYVESLVNEDNSVNERVADASNSSIGSITNDDVESITDLDLSNTNITEVPEVVEFTDNLENLDVSDNEGLTEIPESITTLTNLKTIDVSNTGVTEVPNAVESSNIKILGLGDEPETGNKVHDEKSGEGPLTAKTNFGVIFDQQNSISLTLSSDIIDFAEVTGLVEKETTTPESMSIKVESSKIFNLDMKSDSDFIGQNDSNNVIPISKLGITFNDEFKDNLIKGSRLSLAVNQPATEGAPNNSTIKFKLGKTLGYAKDDYKATVSIIAEQQ